MKRGQSRILALRGFWFVIGGVISSSLNFGMYKVLHIKAGLHSWEAYAGSLSFTMVVLSMWNYHINFRTKRGFRDCFARYIVAVCLCAAMNYAIVAPIIKGWKGHEFLLIVLVQMPMGLFKFLLYHFWVYPPKEGLPRCP